MAGRRSDRARGARRRARRPSGRSRPPASERPCSGSPALPPHSRRPTVHQRSSSSKRNAARVANTVSLGVAPTERLTQMSVTQEQQRPADESSFCEHECSDHRRALASRPGGLASTFSRCAVPEPAAAARVRGVGTRGRVRRYRTRGRSRGLRTRPCRVGVGGGGERGQLVSSSPRSGSAHLDRCRPSG